MTDASAVRPHPSRASIIVAFAAVYVLWGSTYLAIRYAVQTAPPFLMAGSRFLFAGAVLAIWALARGAERPTRENWRAVSIVGTLLFLLGNGVVVWAETRIASGVAALLVATVPLWMVLIPWMRGGPRPRLLISAGIALGLGGLGVLVGPGAVQGTSGIDLYAAGGLMLASLAWASGSIYARRAPLPRSPLLTAGLEMFVGGIALLIAGLLTGEVYGFHLAVVSPRSWLAILYLVIFGSLLGFTAYSWLLGVAAPSRVSTYAYVNPVVAVLLGWAIAGESITPRVAIAAAIIIGAVALITVGQSVGNPTPVPSDPQLPERTPVGRAQPPARRSGSRPEPEESHR
jgi:drug/metabolite transporter (DMT)-like permease